MDPPSASAINEKNQTVNLIIRGTMGLCRMVF